MPLYCTDFSRFRKLAGHIRHQFHSGRLFGRCRNRHSAIQGCFPRLLQPNDKAARGKLAIPVRYIAACKTGHKANTGAVSRPVPGTIISNTYDGSSSNAVEIRPSANAKKARSCFGSGPVSQGCRSRYAARTEARNLPTSCLRRLLSPDSDCAASSTCEDADPVSLAPRCTAPILDDTCWVPVAACCTLRDISCVAAPCSSTAAAMVDDISYSFSMVPLIAWIAVTDSCVAAWMPVIC